MIRRGKLWRFIDMKNWEKTRWTYSVRSEVSGMETRSQRFPGSCRPEVNILEFNMAQNKIGDAEEIVGAVLVEMSGELSGLMMLILKRDFIKTMIKKVLSYEKENLLDMEEMEESLLIEVGNIMLSSYISALSSLTNIQIHLSVPQFAVNMLGGILSMPMAMMGIESDKIMMITGAFSIGGEEMDSNILLLPDIRSLNVLMKKLGVE